MGNLVVTEFQSKDGEVLVTLNLNLNLKLDKNVELEFDEEESDKKLKFKFEKPDIEDNNKIINFGKKV